MLLFAICGDFAGQEIFILKYFNCFQSLQLSKWQLPFIWTVWDTGSNMEILKQKILDNSSCQQYLHPAVLSLLNHFYFDSLASHIIQVYIFVYIFIKLAIFILFLLSLTVTFFLHCMLNILRYEKIFCEIDESIASQHDPSKDVIFLGVHSKSIFPFMEFFSSRKLCFLWSPCLLLTAESVSLDTSGKPTAGFFLKITSPS